MSSQKPEPRLRTQRFSVIRFLLVLAIFSIPVTLTGRYLIYLQRGEAEEPKQAMARDDGEPAPVMRKPDETAERPDESAKGPVAAEPLAQSVVDSLPPVPQLTLPPVPQLTLPPAPQPELLPAPQVQMPRAATPAETPLSNDLAQVDRAPAAGASIPAAPAPLIVDGPLAPAPAGNDLERAGSKNPERTPTEDSQRAEGKDLERAATRGPERSANPEKAVSKEPERAVASTPERIVMEVAQGKDPEKPGPEELPKPRAAPPGKLVTLTLDDTEMRKGLELLAKEGGLNILVSPAVVGKVTVTLKGVTVEQALDALLKTGNLVARQEQGILYIFTAEEALRVTDEQLPIRMYRLNYIRSADVEKMIKPFLSLKGKLTISPPSAVGLQAPQALSAGAGGIPAPGMGGAGAVPGTGGSGGAAGGPAGASGISDTGGDSLASGEVVLIQDRQSILDVIDPLIARLDVQPAQVLIEAVVILVKLDKGKEFGVNFAIINDAGRVLSVIGNGALLNSAVGFKPATLADPATGLVKGNPGFASNQYALSFGFTSGNYMGFIKALETIGKSEVLAAPRLLVLNKQPAQLQLGNRLGYKTISQSLVSTAEQVNFLDVGTLLLVRPFISSDGMIRMEIHPERSSGNLVNGIPQTNTAQVTTNVGVLFRERNQTTTRTELIVLLTPRIVVGMSGGVPPEACPPGSAGLPPPVGLLSLPPPAGPLSLPPPAAEPATLPRPLPPTSLPPPSGPANLPPPISLRRQSP
jgi:type II secretory pathway component GspD/PulD (secretin)